MSDDDELEAEEAAIAAYLESLSAEALRKRLTDLAARYEPIHRRLLTETQAAGGNVDLPALKKELTALMRVSTRHQYWRGAREYADDSQIAIDLVAGVLDAGAADAAIQLAEHLLKRFETALGRLDDSDGSLAWPIEQAGDIHHAACVAAQPDPKKLATRLFDFAMASDYELFIDAPERYAEVLGDEGLDAYAVLLERAAAKLPTSAEDDDRRFQPGWARRYLVNHLRESVARGRGDVDGLVAVMSEDLSSPSAYRRIADALQAADRHREALAWLERSIAKFGPDADDHVLDAALAAYLADGQEADALALAERAFDADAIAESYARLRHIASVTGSWPKQREAALERLRTGSDGWDDDRTEVVLAQVEEGELDGAWADARAGGCRNDVWLQLADASRVDRPDDAIAVYRARVDVLLDDTQHYSDAIKVLKTWHGVLKRSGREGELQPVLQRLREENSRRPNFLKKLDAARLDRA